jgi:hypothetical protein
MSSNRRPSDVERLDAIRQHAHETLRYIATAVLHEDGKNREWLRSQLDLIANFMALVEGDSVDLRSMLARRSEIVDRYLKAAESDPWTGPCSFCGESPTVAWFEGPHFRTFVDAGDKVRADEAWTACARCLELVQANDREELVERGMRRLGDRAEPERTRAMTRRLQDKFWVARSTG